MRSCLRRPQMLIERWEDPGVGLLDADLEFRSRPSGFNDLLASHYDLATHVRMNMTDHSRYCAGVLWLAGETGKRVLYEWVDLCIIDPTPGLKLREQLYLHHAVAEVQPRILDLGESYNWVQPHGSTEQPPADVVIVHGDVQGPAHRATRTSRNPV